MNSLRNLLQRYVIELILSVIITYKQTFIPVSEKANEMYPYGKRHSHRMLIGDVSHYTIGLSNSIKNLIFYSCICKALFKCAHT